MNITEKIHFAMARTQPQYNSARLCGLLDNVFIDLVRKEYREWKQIKKKEIAFQRFLKNKKNETENKSS